MRHGLRLLTMEEVLQDVELRPQRSWVNIDLKKY